MHFLINLFLKLKLCVNFWSQKFAPTYYQCLEYAMTTHFNHSFLLTLTLKTRTYVMALLGLISLKFNPNMIIILILYRLPMGSSSRINTSTIYLKLIRKIWKITTCNTRILTVMPKNLLGHCLKFDKRATPHVTGVVNGGCVVVGKTHPSHPFTKPPSYGLWNCSGGHEFFFPQWMEFW